MSDAAAQQHWHWTRDRMVPHDFYFAGLKDAEKEQCCRYEYFREGYLRGGAVRKLLDHLYQVVLHNDQAGARDLSATFLCWDCFGGVDGFPDSPWLDLKPDVRTAYIQQNGEFSKGMARYNLLRLEARTGEGWLNFTAWKSAQLMRQSGAVFCWVAIWPGSRRRMVEQFRQELTRLSSKHPGLCTERNQGGADNPTSRLNALGALRLLDNRSGGQARELVAYIYRKHRMKAPPIAPQAYALRRSAKRGARLLSEIEEAAHQALMLVGCH